MKRARRLVSLLLIVTLMCWGLWGCGSGDKNGAKNSSGNNTTTATPEATDAATAEPEESAEDLLADIIPKETVELTVYSQLANYSGEQIGWFAQVMKDKFNVKLNIIPTGDGVFSTRMESGELGDIVIFGQDGDEYKQAIQGGLLLDWNEDEILQDYGPYINENMQVALQKNKDISGGTLYGFGHNVGSSSDEHESFFYHPDIRWDLYAKLGYPEVNTLEDFIPVLEKMVKENPTSDSGQKTYAMSLFKDWDGDMVMYVKALGALYGYDEFGFTLYDVNTQTAQPILDDNSMYLRSLKFYNQLYQKGLLDPDSMTQTSTEASDAYTDGAAVFNIFNFLGQALYNTDTHTSEGKGMFALAAKDMKVLSYGLNVYGGNRVWSIGANTQYPELCMAIINWLSTPEGVMTSNYGPQRVSWDYDDQGYAYLTDLGAASKADQKTEMTDGYSGTFEDGNFKMNNTTWALDSINPDGNGEPFNYLFWGSTLKKETTNAEQEWKKYTGYLSADEYLNDGRFSVAIGTNYSTGAKSDELSTTWNQVKEAIKTYSWNAIYAKTDAEFDTIVAELQSKAKEYGYDDCIAWCMNEAALRKAAEDKAKAAN
jgi:putative aldouronate transport system substrate-binding protein